MMCATTPARTQTEVPLRPRLGTAHLVLGGWCLAALVWALAAPRDSRTTPIDQHAQLATWTVICSGLYLAASAAAHATLGRELRRGGTLPSATKLGLLLGHSAVGLAVILTAGRDLSSLAYLLGLGPWIATLGATCLICLAVLLVSRGRRSDDSRGTPLLRVLGQWLQPAAALLVAGLLTWIDRLPLPYVE